MQDPNPDNSPNSLLGQEDLAQYSQWLADFRTQFAETHGWSEGDKKERMLEVQALVRDGQPVYVEEGETPP